MIKGILIDLGKTILTNRVFHFFQAEKSIYDLVIEKEKCSCEEFVRIFDLLYRFSAKIARMGLSEINLPEFIDSVLKVCNLELSVSISEAEDVFLENLMEEELINGSLDFLKEIKKLEIPVIAISNSCITSRALIKELDTLGAMSYINDVISSADIYIRKPRAEIFNKGIELLRTYNSDITKENVLFVGNDYECDILGSYKVGLIPAWYNVSKDKDEKNIAKFDFSFYGELIEIVKENI